MLSFLDIKRLCDIESFKLFYFISFEFADPSVKYIQTFKSTNPSF